MIKKLFLSVISLVFAASLAVGVVAQAEDPSASEIYGNTIFRPEYRSNTFAEGVFAGMVSDFITACLDDLSEAYVNNNRAPNVQSAYLNVDANSYRIQNITMPSFAYLGGKTRLIYKRTLQQNEPYWVDVTVDIFYCGGYDYGYTPWLQWSDGVSIPVNSLIYTITRMDGSTNRYFLRLNANSLSSPWGISFSQSSDVDYFTLLQDLKIDDVLIIIIINQDQSAEHVITLKIFGGKIHYTVRGKTEPHKGIKLSCFDLDCIRLTSDHVCLRLIVVSNREEKVIPGERTSFLI